MNRHWRKLILLDFREYSGDRVLETVQREPQEQEMKEYKDGDDVVDLHLS